ncbi:S8 family serine peptidase [Nocardioides sp. MH1]|uniref:S8 family serine peptidase n=1 Tax=Nocardioides sp. MH1 TaxID=3242490 RepID=UPI003520A32C
MATLVGLAVLIAPLSASGAPSAEPHPVAPPGQGPGDVLGKHDNALIAQALADGDDTVQLLVVTDPGRGDQVSASIDELGGTVMYRTDAVDYLRVRVPVAKAGAVAALGDVSAVDVDEVLPVEGRVAGRSALDPLPQSPPGAGTARNNPYLPTQDALTSQFTTTHPKWDGRGTRIAVVDTGVDLGNPALRTTSTGQPKIVDWVTATDPSFTGSTNSDDDPTWIQMTTSVDADPTFTAGGSTWTAPAAGTYRFGVFNERDARLGGELGNDVDRDGNPAGSSGLFGVLWDQATDDVYVDTDQEHSFADGPAMTDYVTNHDVEWFGTDDPETPVREAVPFVVQTAAAAESVNIGLVSGAQGTHVAGVAAGNDVFGGVADGAAPGAQLVSVRACLFVAGCTNHALIEGMIYAARDADVDVIDLSVAQTTALNDANNARAELYDALTDTYGVQIVVPAGDDGAGLNTVDDPSVAATTLAVGSYVSKATRLSNYGTVVGRVDNLDATSSSGPREDGGFKPDLVAPGSAVAPTPTWESGLPEPGTYSLPPGLGMLDGTAVAAAQVAGASAVLVSAADASSVPWSPAALRTALRSGARFLTGYGAYRQGTGLLRTNAAWQVLKAQPRAEEVDASVETHTVLSGFLKTPGIGTGIYDREGVAVGDRYTRTYTVTRTTGPATAITAQLSWTGNDGTFSAYVDSVRLPKNRAVQINVRVRVGSAGVHSAILNLDDPESPGVELQTLNTVVAPYELGGASSTRRVEGTVDRGQTQSYFFRVAAGTTALSFRLTGPSGARLGGQLRFLRFHPYGTGVDANGDGSCFFPAVAGCASGGPTNRNITDPTPGVWEVVVEARRSSDQRSTPFWLTVSALGVTVAPDPDVISSVSVGTPASRSYTVTNAKGAFVGRAIGGALGSARVSVPTISDGQQSQFTVPVTAGSTELRATVGDPSDPSDPSADLDLFVYSCVTGTCVLAGQSATSGADESVVIHHPAVGTWVVLVDGVAVPGGSMTYAYADVVANPAYGTLAVTDTDATRRSGTSWSVPGTVTATASPPSGRVLLGSVEVVTSTGEVVGSNDVIVQAVH